MTTISLDDNQLRDEIEQQLLVGKRRRRAREALTGYIFVFPAMVATLIFGLWPVVAGFYESLKSGSPITNKYVGLNNYLRALGSLTYVFIFALSLIFIYGGYRAWRAAILYGREHGGNPWYFVLPGLLAGASLISGAFILVTGIDGYSWFPISLLVISIAGYGLAQELLSPPPNRNSQRLWIMWGLLAVVGAVWIAGPALIDAAKLGTLGWIGLAIIMGVLTVRLLPHLSHLQNTQYIATSLSMGTALLLAILLGYFGLNQLENAVEEAQDIAQMIFNQDVLDSTVLVTDEDTLISGLSFADEVTVEVEVGSEVIEAPLAEEVYSNLPADDITRVETAFANKQKVMVVLPDGSIAEGVLTGVPSGERLTVNLVGDDPVAVREIRIYSALDVGEGVVQRGGYTEPLRKQFYAAMLVFIGLGTIALMSWVRRNTDDEEHPAIYRWLYWGRILIGVAIVIAFFYLIGAAKLNQQAATGMSALSEDQFKWAYEYAYGERPSAAMRTEVLQAELLYWPQVFSIAVGAALIGAAYLVWQSVQKRETKLGFTVTLMLAICMMVGGWLILGELPRTLAMGGRETEEAVDSLTRTAMYSIGTVPVQLALGLFLAYLLFSEISWGKSLYRVIYFMPYIAPSVATSTVFLIIFNNKANNLANQALSVFGLEPLTWLKEPNGIVRIFYENILGGNPLHIPENLAGPSLALTTVIIYNIWVFAGYNAVVFLAGLGAIPTELYEAAEVDGAGRWSRFRNITLPLLSPTTFFLSMLSIIGTFKAFSHIYVLRRMAVGKEIDTMSVHIFNTLYSANDPGYAAALAFALFGVILILTLVQNRLAREQVFYG